MIKRIVHIVRVKRQGEKLQFQVKLPSNVNQILSIWATANPAEKRKISKEVQKEVRVAEKLSIRPVLPVFPVEPVKPVLPILRITEYNKEIGWLWLRLSECRDVFYTQIIRQSDKLFNQSIHLHKSPGGFGGGLFWINGKQHQEFNVTAEPDTQVLEGYYVDRFGTGLADFYELKIYLTLEV